MEGTVVAGKGCDEGCAGEGSTPVVEEGEESTFCVEVRSNVVVVVVVVVVVAAATVEEVLIMVSDLLLLEADVVGMAGILDPPVTKASVGVDNWGGGLLFSFDEEDKTLVLCFLSDANAA